MRPRRYSSHAIVLSRKNYSDTDRILVLYTKDYGKVTVIAKGVRKPKSRKRGHIEIFSNIKIAAAKGRGELDILTEVETIDSYMEIRKSLKKTSVAYFIVEVVNKLTVESEENREFFDLIIQYLNSFKHKTSLKKLRYSFIFKSLVLLGYWPIGKKMHEPDKVLENIIEREVKSVRIGKKMLS
jgi:DNA repair protein RecO (recombination protein O)